MNTVNSPSLNAKLKAMYSKKLKNNDFDDLLKQNTISEAIILLKSKLPELNDLPIDANRIELEDSLDSLLINDMKKIIKYLQGINKEIFEEYILRYKINAIKQMYEEISVHNTISQNNWVNELFTDLKPLYNVTNPIEFIEKIPDKDIRLIFQTKSSIFERENALDKYYFENFFKLVKGKNKNIESLLKMRIDLLNVLWTYRCKKYYGIMDKNILINVFYHINLDTIQKINEANSLEDLNQILHSTIYSNILHGDIEHDIKTYYYRKCKKTFRNEILDLSMVISYFMMLETEKENVVTIIEGIRYKMTKQNIDNKIII